VSFAVWLTAAPASGKTTIARALRDRLAAMGVPAVWLESDAVRAILAPGAGYAPEERDRFYAALADLAALLVEQGFDVLVDATAPRRAHRQKLRDRVPGLIEVLVETPLDVREARDPKGLYARAREGRAPHLPGATEAYEAPLEPALTLSGAAPPEENADRILDLLRNRRLLDRGVPAKK
jgi:adenylylsulfate kinase